MRAAKALAGLAAIGAGVTAIVVRARTRGRRPAQPLSQAAEPKTHRDTTGEHTDEQTEELTAE